MNISTLSTEELIQLRDNIDSELENRIQMEKDKLIQDIKIRAEALNIPMKDILQEAGKLSKRKVSVAKPKYRNPNNEEETWSGRGRQPLWLSEQLKVGKQLEDFLISQETQSEPI